MVKLTPKQYWQISFSKSWHAKTNWRVLAFFFQQHRNEDFANQIGSFAFTWTTNDNCFFWKLSRRHEAP